MENVVVISLLLLLTKDANERVKARGGTTASCAAWSADLFGYRKNFVNILEGNIARATFRWRFLKMTKRRVIALNIVRARYLTRIWFPTDEIENPIGRRNRPIGIAVHIFNASSSNVSSRIERKSHFGRSPERRAASRVETSNDDSNCNCFRPCLKRKSGESK